MIAQPAAAAVEVRSERFRVVAEANVDAAIQAASHLEATADRLARSGLYLRRPDLPVTVLIFAGQEQLARFQDRSHARAFAATAEDSHFIAIAWDAPGSPWLALAHEYAHLASDDGTLPPWFREGLADYLSLGRDNELNAVTATNSIAALRSRPWLGIRDLLDAQDGSAAYGHELFYAQSWLAVSWLASQPDAASPRLEPQRLYDLLALQGSAAVEIQLRAHMARLALQEPQVEALPEPLLGLKTRELDQLVWQAWELELLRGMRGNFAAEAELLQLEANRPQLPQVQAALGALAIERGRFDEAEARLQVASADADASAHTHQRYALMLLRPSAGEPAPRAEAAIAHALQALALVPDKPAFLRTLAQASIVAGHWNRAAQVLLNLQAKQGWEATAGEDFHELLRSRWQRLRAVDAPRIGPLAPHTAPAFAKARLAPLREPHDYAWPPPDTRIFIGRIARVDCSTSQKRIVMEHPLFRVEFVESPKQPAKLHHPPLKWKTIPCDTYGWNVNIAYVPYRGKGALTGEARAILF